VNRIVVLFMLAFFFGSLLSAVMEGGGGFAATRLTTTLTDVATTATVSSTNGFLKSGVVYIGNEQVKYVGTSDTQFGNLTRGYDGTTASAHGVGEKAFTSDTDVINSALGFDVTTTGATVGAVNIPLALWRFATVSIPRIITWDYAWLKPSGMGMIRMFLAVITTGFVVYISYNIAMALGGILQGAFRRP